MSGYELSHCAINSMDSFSMLQDLYIIVVGKFINMQQENYLRNVYLAIKNAKTISFLTYLYKGASVNIKT